MQRIFIIVLISFTIIGCQSQETPVKKEIKPSLLAASDFEFRVESSRAVSGQEANQSEVEERHNKDEKEVLNLLSDYYFNNFVDFNNLNRRIKQNKQFEFFTEKLIKDLDKNERQKLYLQTFKIPINKAKVRVADIEDLVIYYDNSANPLFSAVEVDFQAIFTLKNGQKASFRSYGKITLELINSNWKITGYTLTNEIKS